MAEGFLLENIINVWSALFSLLNSLGWVLLTSFLVSSACGWVFLKGASYVSWGKTRIFTPDTHKKKDATPAMGGVVIILSIITVSWLFLGIYSSTLQLTALFLLLFGCIGLWDDLCKLRKTRGISAKEKFLLQVVCAVVGWWVWSYMPFYSSTIYFFGYTLDAGWLFSLWAAFIIVACSNAVNITDGLDGLATVNLIPNFALFTVISFFYFYGLFFPADSAFFSQQDLYSIAVISTSVVGSLFGFLWYNRHPARMFMGDVGSLSLGALLALFPLLLKAEYLLLISGLVFIAETVSVILQVLSFKLRKKRIFKMAPLHHHFELCGYHETTIVIYSIAISACLCFILFLMLLFLV